MAVHSRPAAHSCSLKPVLALLALISAQAQKQYDIIVYGATPAGCSAAMIAANGTGAKVALLEVSPNIGGMMVPGGIGLRDTDNFDSAFGNGSVARAWANLNGRAYGVPYVLQPDVVIGNASLYALIAQVQARALASGGALDVYTNTGLVEAPGAVAKTGTTISSITTVDTSASPAALAPWETLEVLAQHGLRPLDAHPLRLPQRVRDTMYARAAEKARINAASAGAATGSQTAGSTAGTTTWTAGVFIDASYDGDLVVAGGLDYTFGREAQDTYNESLAGVQPWNRFQNFVEAVDPYDGNGQPLPFIETGDLPPAGSADEKLMPFSYRSCLTQDASNQVPFPQPPGYTGTDFELVRRYVASFNKTKYPNGPSIINLVGVYDYGGPVPYPSGKGPSKDNKYDMCEGGSGTEGQTSPVTTDQPDINDGYVQADRAGRAVVAAKVFYWTAGFMWTLANDAGIPEGTRNSTNKYGLCKDTIPYWGPAAWPTQLYVREGVRMVTDYVANQVNVVKGVCTPDSVASSAWTIDIHPMRRVALPAGAEPTHYGNSPAALNEGQVGFAPFPGNGSVWEVRYAIMTPKRTQATNLLVPVCNSASHVVYGSIRVEPTFIQIGQAAGAAALLAHTGGVAVQDVPIAQLQAMQRANGVEPHYPPGRCT